ncbi:MAG TPA: hypothetical protein VEW48_22620 [Thermoanaerobaculia bacterium]|nr:hypothetical protein [Thermoanaerobaculia bacterium]
MTCPKCGWARELNAVECPACGIVYARYTGAQQRPSRAGTDAFAPPPPLPAQGALNPYAPPQSNLQGVVETPQGQMFGTPGGGVWRTGDLLVMQKGASLPYRCLVCNQPASVQFPRKMYWHHPWVYLMILPGILIYAIIAMIVRKRADVVLPLCAEHAAKRKRSATWGNLLLISGFVVMFGSCSLIDSAGDGNFGLVLGLGFLLLIVGLIVAVGANPVVPKKIDDYYVWLRKVSASYLAALPPAPPGL